MTGCGAVATGAACGAGAAEMSVTAPLAATSSGDFLFSEHPPAATTHARASVAAIHFIAFTASPSEPGRLKRGPDPPGEAPVDPYRTTPAQVFNPFRLIFRRDSRLADVRRHPDRSGPAAGVRDGRRHGADAPTPRADDRRE